MFETFDSSTGNLISSSKYLYNQILSDEIHLNRDLTDDGIIGDRISQELSKHQSSNKSLYKTESGSLIIDNSNITNVPVDPTLLKNKDGSALFTTKQNNISIAIDQEEGGSLYWGAGSLWNREIFDSSRISSRNQKI